MKPTGLVKAVKRNQFLVTFLEKPYSALKSFVWTRRLKILLPQVGHTVAFGNGLNLSQQTSALYVKHLGNKRFSRMDIVVRYLAIEQYFIIVKKIWM